MVGPSSIRRGDSSKQFIGGNMYKLTDIGLATGVFLAVLGSISWAQTAGTDGTEFYRVLPGQEKWVDYKGDGAQFGIKEAFIFGDPTKPGLYVIRLKIG